MFPLLFPFLLLTLSAILLQYSMYFGAGGNEPQQITIIGQLKQQVLGGVW